MKAPYVPALVPVLREGVLRSSWAQDLLAGLIVGVLAFPLALAFAIASGLPPETGWITSVVAGLVVALGSGSRFQIGGPTGTLVVIVHQTVVNFGHSGLLLASAMAGVMLIGLGLMRLGGVIRYIPYPVTIAFASAIALIIATLQIPDMMGWSGSWPDAFGARWWQYAQHLGETNWLSVALCLTTIGIVTQMPHLSRRVPGSVVALVVTTLLTVWLDLPVPTVGSRFPELTLAVPVPQLPPIDWALIQALVPYAATIALQGGLESLVSCMVSDGMTGQRHRPNTELIGQGLANIATSFFAGMPSAGVIARTAANIKNGGRTPLAGVAHVVVLLAMGLALGQLVRFIPLATLAGILLVVAYHMSEWRLFLGIFHRPREDVGVLLVTFFLTLFFDLTLAVQSGVILAALLFMRRMANSTTIEPAAPPTDNAPLLAAIQRHDVQVFRLSGPFFFGAADTCINRLERVDSRYRTLVLDFSQVPWMDATGLRALQTIIHQMVREKRRVILTAVHDQPREVIDESGMLTHPHAPTLAESIEAALESLNAPKPPEETQGA